MGVRIKWAAANMVASVRGFVRNTLTYKALLLIFWSSAFLLPRALLVLAYMLKAYADLTGKELKFGNNNRDMD
jgi:hypothetical protein